MGLDSGGTRRYVSYLAADHLGGGNVLEAELPYRIRDPMAGAFSSDNWDLVEEEKDRVRLLPVIKVKNTLTLGSGLNMPYHERHGG